MFLKPEEIYSKFNDENIQVIIPKKLLFTLLQQADRLREVLSNEEVEVNNFAIYDYISKFYTVSITCTPIVWLKIETPRITSGTEGTT